MHIAHAATANDCGQKVLGRGRALALSEPARSRCWRASLGLPLLPLACLGGWPRLPFVLHKLLLPRPCGATSLSSLLHKLRLLPRACGATLPPLLQNLGNPLQKGCRSRLGLLPRACGASTFSSLRQLLVLLLRA